MLNQAELFKLASIANNTKAPSVAYSCDNVNYSLEEVNDLLRKELNELSKDYRTYERNKNTIFELIEKTIDEVLPVKVREQYAAFAEVQQVAQGDSYRFVQKITEASKKRAKQFITRVGLAGTYEVFKLDGKSFEVKTNAIGGACYIPLEEFLDKRVSWADVYDIVLEGMDDYIYQEIETALISLATCADLADNNKKTNAGFSETMMDTLLSIADSYSVAGKSTIYCTFEFASKMIPTQGVFASNNYSNEMKNELWNKGYFAKYKEHDVVIFRQSMTDTTNATKVLDPQYAWIIPNGADSKPVKIVFEGDTKVREIEMQGDWSRHLDTYKKVGVGIVTVNPGICVFQNSSLSKTVDTTGNIQ